jgi:hypothetical protein
LVVLEHIFRREVQYDITMVYLEERCNMT